METADQRPTLKGRGAHFNTPNRFERLRVVDDFEHVEGDEEFAEGLTKVPTQYYVDHSRTIIAHNDSPDVGFEWSINPYRGCSHGCAYCYARPGHEFLGFSAGIDFESKIMVKADAPRLLREEISNPRWVPNTLSISGVTDCYQPIERKLRLTRQCLEVLAECRHPCTVITKNHLVTRDIDLFTDLARHDAVGVFISVTTLDKDLAMRMEPRTASPARRLAAIEALTRAGIPVGVMVAPIIPGLTDHETPAILDACARAGAVTAGYVPLRLPMAVADVFCDFLRRHYPDRAGKVIARIRDVRGGKLNDAHFNSRMRGDGVFAEQIKQMFTVARRKAGLDAPFPDISAKAFNRPERGGQMTMFG